MMKVQKRQAYKLLMFYTETLHSEFGNRFLTLAIKELLERRLQELQEQCKRSEPQNQLYQIPVKIVYFDDIKQHYEVNFSNTEEIEFIGN